MPIQSSWKKETATLISRLSSKRAAAAAAGNAALVVQTGFPTSLADLVVKNHKRVALKKNRKNKPRPDRNPVNPNPIPSPAVRSQSDSDRTADVKKSATTAVTKKRGLGLGFVAAVLVVLAVGKKWVVAGITILSLFMLVLELLGLFEKLKPEPRSEEERVTVVDLAGRGLVSPIREELQSVVSDSGSYVSAERRDLSDVVDGDLGDLKDVLVERNDFDENSKDSIKKKKKKLFKRIFGKKYNRKGDESKENSPSSANEGDTKKESCQSLDDRGEIESLVTDNEEEIVYEDCHDDMETLNLEIADGVAIVNSEEMEVVVTVGKNVDAIRLWRWRNLAFFAVLLLGLLGGKLVALVLTLAWFLLSECTGMVWRKWENQ